MAVRAEGRQKNVGQKNGRRFRPSDDTNSLFHASSPSARHRYLDFSPFPLEEGWTRGGLGSSRPKHGSSSLTRMAGSPELTERPLACR